MRRIGLIGPAFAAGVLMMNSALGNFATSVQTYNPGIGYATTFSGVPYTNADAALGAPNRQTSFGEVQPFNPPYAVNEIVSMGTNGFIVLQLDAPIRNHPSNPFGIDFIIYGSAGFIDFDYPNGRTDAFASMFGQSMGSTRVSVSADGSVFYTLNPALAPTADGLYPTDGRGMIGLPVNPALTQADFANKSLDDIRALYAGAAGGTGYDLAWALDTNGASVILDTVRFVRIEVLSGRAEIDAVATPNPEALSLVEDFSQSPESRGWHVFGDDSLFQWNSTSKNVDVTWDSRVTNSHFYYPLRTVLTKNDDFHLQFDLRIRDVMIGVTPGRPYTFEVAIGFINLASAKGTNFYRGTQSGTRNIVEFNYFPEFSSFGATVAATVVSSNGMFAYSHNFPMELPLDETVYVAMTYTATNRTLNTRILRNGDPFGPIQDVVLPNTFSDFRCDALSISSYSDERADGSLLAHGTVDNLRFTVPTAPVHILRGGLVQGVWQVTFASKTGWLYQLERSIDLVSWTGASAQVPGNGAQLTLQDTATQTNAFYRVQAKRP